MPLAICNTCKEILNGKNVHMKRMICHCGSKDLTAVSGRYSDDMTTYTYYDRHGNKMKEVKTHLHDNRKRKSTVTGI
jgi:hypothetical protein